GYMLEARALHGMGTRGLLNEFFPYGYADGLLRVDVDVGAEGVVTVTGVWNEESVDLDTTRSGVDPARWGNAAGAVRYRGDVRGDHAAGQREADPGAGGLAPDASERGLRH